jgi:DNA ligase-1
MKLVDVGDVRSWYEGSGNLGQLVATIGRRDVDPDFVSDTLGLPLHLALVVERLAEDGELAAATFDSIPFYSLCRGLFLPLTGMSPEKAAQIFGVKVAPPPGSAERQELLARFMARDLGLTVTQKLGCLLGDPFEGRPSTFKRESLLRLLGSVQMKTRRELLDRLTIVGDVAVLFAESRPAHRREPALTAAEVLASLRLVPDLRRTLQFDLLRSLLERCGKVEAFFLARLMLGKAGLRYEGDLVARLIGERYGVDAEQVAHAMALTDSFRVARLLEAHGADGLRRIQLQPLVAVRPALAAGGTETLKKFPVWVERKYDGIRLMLHKTTDRLGSVLTGAYSRGRRDYLEQVPGLAAVIKALPARAAIVDGELHGTLVGLDGVRPATVYELFGAMNGEASRPTNLKFAAFDLIYLDGQDLTDRPLAERRQRLQLLLAPLQGYPLPIAVALAEGQMAESMDDVNRLYQHFRSQGYEGVITKDLKSPYRLAARDPAWLKKKPSVTLDLVLLGAVLAVTTKEKTGMFGSYVIGARLPDGSFEDVGDVAGVDQVRDAEIRQLIMSEGLLTGRRIERQSASGVRPGFELAPHVVVAVRFEGVIRDPASGRLTLRDPKLVATRADKAAHEADAVKAIEELYLKQKFG